MLAADTLKAQGHTNIRASHRTTIEVTCERSLTPRGDCIVGVCASKAVSGLSKPLRKLLEDQRTAVLVVFKAHRVADALIAWGDRRLKLENDRSLVIRRSDFVDDRTLAIKSNKAARDLSRALVEALRRGKELEIAIIAAKHPYARLLFRLQRRPLKAWALARLLTTGASIPHFTLGGRLMVRKGFKLASDAISGGPVAQVGRARSGRPQRRAFNP